MTPINENTGKTNESSEVFFEKSNPKGKRPENLVEKVYQRIKKEIFDFQMLPGDRFSETEVAQRMETSRTPVREALFRLQREGFLEVHFRNGWRVKPFDFQYFDELYDIRILLENASLQKICDFKEWPEIILRLADIWLVPQEERLSDGEQVSKLDELFHHSLVQAGGNREMVKIHEGITEHIRIIRRLDFFQEARLTATYNEHNAILKALLDRRIKDAQNLLSQHISQSKEEVRKITLHKLHTARS